MELLWSVELWSCVARCAGLCLLLLPCLPCYVPLKPSDVAGRPLQRSRSLKALHACAPWNSLGRLLVVVLLPACPRPRLCMHSLPTPTPPPVHAPACPKSQILIAEYCSFQDILTPDGVHDEVPGHVRLLDYGVQALKHLGVFGVVPAGAGRREDYYTRLAQGSRSSWQAGRRASPLLRSLRPPSLRSFSLLACWAA